MLSSQKREELKNFIIDNVKAYPRHLVGVAAKEFAISRQAVLRHVRDLIKLGVIDGEGKGRSIKYSLHCSTVSINLDMVSHCEEHKIWLEKILPLLPPLNKNVLDICSYGTQEMLNNVIEHSGTEKAIVEIDITIKSVTFWIIDFGVGIFNKIQRFFNLDHPQQAILELQKGGVTTDKTRHSGQGIFFTSRLFDDYCIMSENLFFNGHQNDDWITSFERDRKGTTVVMEISRECKTIDTEVFNKYSSKELKVDFSKTKISVALLKQEGAELVSRSQARRLIAGFDRFEKVVLNFSGVRMIGQAFADELFRVFSISHPNVRLVPIFMNDSVCSMVNHVSVEGKYSV